MTNIHVHVEDAVATITIDRPERFNSLDVDTARDLRKAALSVARNNTVRAVVLRGRGSERQRWSTYPQARGSERQAP